MKNRIVRQLILSALGLVLLAGFKLGGAPGEGAAAKLEWWREARFGMFVHWGPVSLKGTEIGWSRGQPIPIEEYDHLYQQFNPTNFDADTWMEVAKSAGMKYMVFTTKHHDGFCMWGTKQTDFNIMQSPFHRDVVKELSAAARRHGLEFATYHSVCDWHHPDFPLTSPGGSVRRPISNLDRYEEYLRAQVKELITGYGPLLIMWFDVPQEFDHARGLRLEQWTRSLQPDIIINNRSGAGGDYDTPEQRVGKFQMNRPWETCMTICQQWAWKPADKMKSLEECLHSLILCAGGDGNLLFNVGPMPDGRIEQRQIDRLREMGAWLAKYGQTIYGTRGGPWMPTKAIASTRKGNSIYVHLLNCKGETVELPTIAAKIVRSSLLTGGQVEVKESGDKLQINVPAADCRDIDTIVKLELGSPASDIQPIATARGGKTVKATASNVYQKDSQFAPEMAFDDDPETRWATDAGTHQAWIAVDLGKVASVQNVRICEECGSRVQKFELQYKDVSDWKTIFAGTTIGPEFSRKCPTVKAREFRLNILEASEGPTISEISFSEQTR
jgi:alpha-L-fucosidase